MQNKVMDTVANNNDSLAPPFVAVGNPVPGASGATQSVPSAHNEELYWQMSVARSDA